MDLNDLLHSHQIAQMCATHAASPEAAHAHRARARAYANRIATIRELLGASGRMVTA